MTPLEKLFAEESQVSSERARHGSIGVESDWIDFGTIQCRSGQFLIIDPAFAPSADDGVVVECSVGDYHLHAKVIDYGGDPRVSRLRGLKNGSLPPREMKQIGEAWADVAAVGVCDAVEFAKIFPEDESKAEDLINEYLEVGKPAGELVIGNRSETPLKYVSSEFGDGTFPVFAHVQGEETVGFEVEFIEPGTPYPFGEIESSAQAQQSTDSDEKKADPVMDAIFSALKDFKHTGSKEGNKEQLRQLMEKAAAPFVEELLNASEEMRQRLVQRRKGAPRMEINMARIDDVELSDAERAKLEVFRGPRFIRVGTFKSELPNWRASYCIDPATGIRVEVGQSGDQTIVVVGFNCADQTSVWARDQATNPGMPSGDWSRRIELPGAEPMELLAVIDPEAKKCADQIIKHLPADFPRVAAEGFRRTQMWRANRGGWTRDEIKLQLNKRDVGEEEVEMWHFELRDLWLFNWFRAQPQSAVDAFEHLENLVIIHDDIPSHLVQSLWTWATKDTKTRRNVFNEGKPMETFGRVNEERGRPLQLIARKTTGYPADYYLMR